MRAHLLLLALALPGLAAATNHTLGLPSVINISFIKEVTLSVQPPDFAELVQDGDQQRVEGFLESSLRLLDPIMHFFENFFSAQPAEAAPPSLA
jgi:hypothetical protein